MILESVMLLKVRSYCASCLLRRAELEMNRASTEEKTRFRVMQSVLALLNTEFNSDSVPAYIGAKRDRLIKQLTGCQDPYKEDKVESNNSALKLLPFARKLVKEAGEGFSRFKTACIVSIVGNVIEMDVKDHDFDLKSLNNDFFLNRQLAIDDTELFYKLAKRAKTILYLADNAGEIAFDTILVEELKNLGTKVTVVVKGGPALNDALMKDAIDVGMIDIANCVIDTGTDTVGLLLDEISDHLRKELSKHDIIVAKGMANYETLTEIEYKIPIVHLLIAKCQTIAESLNINRGEMAAILVQN